MLLLGLLLQLNHHLLLLGPLLQLDHHLLLLGLMMQINLYLLLLLLLGPLLPPKGNPHMMLQLLASLVLHIQAPKTNRQSVLLLSLLSPPLPKTNQQSALPLSLLSPLPPKEQQLPSQTITFKMMTETWPHWACGILVLLLLLLLLVKMAIMLVIVHCKSLIYCQVILKAKTNSMLHSLMIVVCFEEL
jgi:hypothetical protein